MPTKEEIALKYVSCQCDIAYTSRGLTAPDCPYHSTDPKSAMDEWAEQEAVAFAKWISNHHLDFQPAKDGKFIGLNLVVRTAEELWKFYKQP